MALTKQEIWERLKTESTWVTATRTPLFATVEGRQFRFVVGIWISGNNQATTTLQLEKLEKDGTTYTVKWSPIPVRPTDFRQIPEGSYDLENPVATFEGGTRLYGKTDIEGMSLNVTVAYWDWDV